MLSGGLVTAIAPTAIDMDKNNTNNDLGGIYEQVEKMQEVLPRLSSINYKLNIDLTNNTDNSTQLDENNLNDTDIDNSSIEDETIDENITSDINNDNITADINSDNNTDANISFSTTDSNGNEINLNNDETINYLNETLNQTNLEYEELKITLSNAIKDTMDYLDAYKNGEQTLTNEQKIYIKEQTNSIKFLAETLEDLSEDVICCIDGCEDCDDEDFETSAGRYLTTINELESRINALNNAIASLQFINNIGNPFFNPNYIMYARYYNDQNNNTNENNDINGNTDLIIDDDATMEVDDNDLDNNQSTDSVENDQSTQDNAQSESNSSSETNEEDDKPTTFGLKSNIDTYAPTKRNIDTFFNTALYNNEYMNGYGYGYGMPYGYGNGYGMPYGAGFGQGYGRELNSNLINRNELEQQENSTSNTNSFANIENETSQDEIKKPKKIHAKRARNIDTYNNTTIKSNINTMGESKISRFFKEKFNNLRNKVKKQKQSIKDTSETEHSPIKDNTSDDNINKRLSQNDNVDNDIDNSKLNIDNAIDTNIDNNLNNSNENSDMVSDSTQQSPTPNHEKDVKAKKEY